MDNVLIVQRVGRKPGGRAGESQDRVCARPIPSGLLLAVADGITTSAYGGSVARWVVDRHLAVDDVRIESIQAMGEALRSYLAGLRDTFEKEFADMPDMLASGCCLVTMAIMNSSWVCCSLGDCSAFRLTPKVSGYEGAQITRPQADRFSGSLTDCFGAQMPSRVNVYEGTIDAGDVVVLASDGAKLDEISLGQSFHPQGFNEGWLQEWADQAIAGRYWDDISIMGYRHTWP